MSKGSNQSQLKYIYIQYRHFLQQDSATDAPRLPKVVALELMTPAKHCKSKKLHGIESAADEATCG